MARWVYLLTAFAGLAAWAGAQNPAPSLTAEDKLRLFKANSTLIDNLVRDGVSLSAAGTPEDRAAQCRSTALALANEIRKAAAAGDTERVAELTVLFRNVVQDGLAPTIKEGLRMATPESPAAQKLNKVRGEAAADITNVKAAIPASGKLADDPRVKDSLKELDRLAEELK